MTPGPQQHEIEGRMQVPLEERCEAMVSVLNAVHGWQVAADEQAVYVSALVRLLPADASDDMLRRRAERFHADHRLVESLRDHHNPYHAAMWTTWLTQAIMVVQRHGQANTTAADVEVLARTTLEELVRAVPTFRYDSHFSTWAYTIIARTISRYLRDRCV